MTRLKNQFFAALGLAVLTGLFILAGVGGSNAAPPSPTPQDVKVVNTAANPDGYVASGPTKIYVTGPVMLRFELFDSAPGNFIAQIPSIAGYLEPAQ